MAAKKKQVSNKNPPLETLPVESANIVILNSIARKVDILNNYISNSSNDVDAMIQNQLPLLL